MSPARGLSILALAMVGAYSCDPIGGGSSGESGIAGDHAGTNDGGLDLGTDDAGCDGPTPTPPPSLAAASGHAGVGALLELAAIHVDRSLPIAVLFGGVPAQIRGWSANGNLELVVPEGARSGPLLLRNGCATYVAPDVFDIDETPAPVVSAIDPPTAAAGATVTIHGAHLTGAGVSPVHVLTSAVVLDDQTIEALAGDTPGTYTIVLESASGRSSSDAGLTITP